MTDPTTADVTSQMRADDSDAIAAELVSNLLDDLQPARPVRHDVPAPASDATAPSEPEAAEGESGDEGEAAEAETGEAAKAAEWKWASGVTEAALAVEAAEGESGDEREAAEGGSGQRSRRRRLLVALPVAVVILGLAGLSGWLGWEKVHSDNLADARKAATKAGVAVAMHMINYSPADVKQSFAAVEKASTPSFAADYDKNSASALSVLQQYKASSTGTVRDVAVEKASTSRAQLVLIVDQTVKTSTKTAGTPEENALLLTMVHQKGRWLLESGTVR